MNALTVGFGSIGCRHVQSLLSSGKYDRIYVIEPSDERFNEGLARIGAKEDDLVRSHDVREFRDKADIAIIATSSAPRFEIVKQLILMGIPCLLLEKIVFQSLAHFDAIIPLLEAHQTKAYCNFTNRYFPNYVELKTRLAGRKTPLSMSVIAGDLGLGSNAIHYMDLFEYLTGESITETRSSLTMWEKENKRGSDYREFSGLLLARTRTGDRLNIYFDPSNQGGVVLHMAFDGREVMLSEGSAIQLDMDEADITSQPFTIIPTSRLTHRIIEDMAANRCPLTTIARTRNTHSFLFHEMNGALNLPPKDDTLCPVT